MEEDMTLVDAELNKDYTIRSISVDDDDLSTFLFRLGCYTGEQIAVISRKKKNCVIALKNARYNIDSQLAETITI